MSGLTADQRQALEPLAGALLAAARARAEAVLAEAEDEGRRLVADAEAEAARLLAEARARGEQDAAPAATADRVRARRAARTAVLRAERDLQDRLRAEACVQVGALLRDPATRERLEPLLRARLAAPGAPPPGAGSATSDVTIGITPDGGLVARSGARAVHLDAQALVDAALARVDRSEPWDGTGGEPWAP